jgi:hypothetical protein
MMVRRGTLDARCQSIVPRNCSRPGCAARQKVIRKVRQIWRSSGASVADMGGVVVRGPGLLPRLLGNANRIPPFTARSTTVRQPDSLTQLVAADCSTPSGDLCVRDDSQIRGMCHESEYW